ncbi:MAG: hypothetical protein L0216_06065, partial [Planctomycetales bacterium]|nr:hypothetical protein [Planctomycetales bacterium]
MAAVAGAQDPDPVPRAPGEDARIAAAIRDLTAPDPARREAAEAALRAAGTAAAPALAGALRDSRLPPEALRDECEAFARGDPDAARRLAAHGTRAVPALQTLADSDDPAVAVRARALLRAAAGPTPEALDAGARAQAAAARLLGEVSAPRGSAGGPANAEAAAALREALRVAPAARVRRAAVAGLARAGPGD